eukprot:TRINITY_DN2210_c0_g1_i1.p1 TRINITY_DN2210_c0_g1~~TRINITY_DN2210_c0_g1_i1.p1  ORF type:complete len:958 (+),score=350.48 TRINITY_DN2210_c0_g1_i1:79-2952(+)
MSRGTLESRFGRSVQSTLDFFVPREPGIKTDDETLRVQTAVAFVIVLAGLFFALTSYSFHDVGNPYEFRIVGFILLFACLGFLVFMKVGRRFVGPALFRFVSLHYIPFVFFLNSFYVSVFLLEEHTYVVSTWMTTCSVAAAFFLGFRGALTYLLMVLASHIYTYCNAHGDPRAIPQLFKDNTDQYHWYFLVSSSLQVVLLTSFAGLYEVVIASQLSEIRKAVNELAALNQSLDKANRSKSEFLKKFSHELRTPLNGILGIGQLLQKTHLDHDQGDYVHLLLVSGYSLLQQINNILDFTRLETCTAETARVDMNICNVVEDAVQFLGRSALDRGNQIKAIISEDAATTLRGDKDHLWRCLVNIIGNSVKHTTDGLITVTVTAVPDNEEARMVGDDIRPTEEPVSFLFEVTDTGSGIPEEHLSCLFKPFLQHDQFQQGTGLGLVITRELVHANAGKMSVVSRVGEGSTFSFTYRFYKPKLSEATPTTQRQPIVRTFGSSGDNHGSSRSFDHAIFSTRQSDRLSEDLVGQMMLPRRRSQGPKPDPLVVDGAVAAHLRRRLHSSLPAMPASLASSAASGAHLDDNAQVVLEPSVEWTVSGASYDTSPSAEYSSSVFGPSVSFPTERPASHAQFTPATEERGNRSAPPSFSAYPSVSLRCTTDSIRTSFDTMRSDSEVSDDSAGGRYRRLSSGTSTPLFRSPTEYSTGSRTSDGAPAMADEGFGTRVRVSNGPLSASSSASSNATGSSGHSHGSQRSRGSFSRGSFHDEFRGLTEASAPAVSVGSLSGSDTNAPTVTVAGGPEAPDQATRRKGEILLVEDNLINQKVAARMVTNAGYNCTIAENGLRAVELMETNKFDLVLMDCLMPVMDGFEATRTLRSNPRFRRLPVVALTACTGDTELQKCMQSGMNEILNRPINVIVLLGVIKKYLEPDAADELEMDDVADLCDARDVPPIDQQAPPN